MSPKWKSTLLWGTQKNRLNETVLLGTQNICENWWEGLRTNFLFTLAFDCVQSVSNR